MKQLSHIIQASTPHAEPVDLDRQVYRKEVIYPGHFVKKNQATRETEFDLTVDDARIDHWVKTFQRMKDAGIEVPVPIEHTEDPEKRRGTVVDLKKEYNPERGVNALYAYVRFTDSETAEKLAKTSQVSLYSPPEYIDGKGRIYKFPIRHIAITDYPVIPELSKWEAVKASLVLSESGASQMITLKTALDRLGVSYPDGADDETLMGILEEAWNADDGGLSDDDELLEDEPSDDELLEDELSDDELLEDELSDDELLEEGLSDDELLEEEPQLSKRRLSARRLSARRLSARRNVSMSAVSALCSSRNAALEGLVQQGKITPYQKKELVAAFASKKRVALSLSSGSVGNDGFESVMKTLSMSTGRRYGERTAAQQHGNGDKSPLIADAERRAAKRK